jgi:hypothetical protein
MSIAWWLGVVAVGVVAAVLSDMHWTVIDFVMDRFPGQSNWRWFWGLQGS